LVEPATLLRLQHCKSAHGSLDTRPLSRAVFLLKTTAAQHLASEFNITASGNQGQAMWLTTGENIDSCADAMTWLKVATAE